MTHTEALQDILKAIGSLIYGKERWFPHNGVWYDRIDGSYISTGEMAMRVCTALYEELSDG